MEEGCSVDSYQYTQETDREIERIVRSSAVIESSVSESKWKYLLSFFCFQLNLEMHTEIRFGLKF